jgi:CTP:phosphocholine cytidylyltransferase-like protein
LHEKFDDLVEKYKLIKVVNDKYDIYNNIYTMYLVREYLEDAFVIDADNYITRNFLPKTKPDTSVYYSACKENIVGEWILKYDDSGKIFGVDIGKEGDKPSFIMSGASFWTANDARIICEKVQEAVEINNKLNFLFCIVPSDSAVEILKFYYI